MGTLEDISFGIRLALSDWLNKDSYLNPLGGMPLQTQCATGFTCEISRSNAGTAMVEAVTKIKTKLELTRCSCAVPRQVAGYPLLSRSFS